jgi:hypothetical protein
MKDNELGESNERKAFAFVKNHEISMMMMMTRG